MLKRLLGFVLTLGMAAPVFAQNSNETFCKLIPGNPSTPVFSNLRTIASCVLPCFNFDPGNRNTLITYEGSNEIAYTYSADAPPSQIDVNLRVACQGGTNPPADIHTYTIFNGSPAGATLTAIGQISGQGQTNFDPLAPTNPWCTAAPFGCTVQLQMDAVTPGNVGITVVTNPPPSTHSDTAILLKGVPLTN
jgi:hypothetical protein